MNSQWNIWEGHKGVVWLEKIWGSFILLYVNSSPGNKSMQHERDKNPKDVDASKHGSRTYSKGHLALRGREGAGGWSSLFLSCLFLFALTSTMPWICIPTGLSNVT